MVKWSLTIGFKEPLSCAPFTDKVEHLTRRSATPNLPLKPGTGNQGFRTSARPLFAYPSFLPCFNHKFHGRVDGKAQAGWYPSKRWWSG